SPRPASAAVSHFDATTAGTVQGRVLWRGAIPDLKPATFPVQLPNGFHWDTRPAPNAPDIDFATRAVRNAVVFLRGVDPAAARPWDLPPVSVEQRDMLFRVIQGEGSPRTVGFVRRGDSVELVS